MDNPVFIFIANVIGGIVVFYGLAYLFGVVLDTDIESAFAVGIFLFLQLCFVTTLLFTILHKVNSKK
ncbi:hypothetical protein IHV12_04875 [Fictibacillus sp. 7GRE50]|uniref:hypothetical protein n=1 Tax=Fictibacillus sp. 7GRE50 TaxID=2745878 RepID=UPI0018CF38F2|nr:hypothetical protein [Fictibacillus sp. 7GRE50]MBH0164236.1 hypothetical protein [Fictibacillus sp. 7GRE50]